MPTYSFWCPECGAAFNQKAPIEQGPVDMDCPVCAFEDIRVVMKRVWHAVPAHFKGSGWGGQ